MYFTSGIIFSVYTLYSPLPSETLFWVVLSVNLTKYLLVFSLLILFSFLQLYQGTGDRGRQMNCQNGRCLLGTSGIRCPDFILARTKPENTLIINI